MKKNVYSIVLMDDVIRAVDREACRLGTSRSNLINSILAQHLSYTTPEMRLGEIYSSISELMSQSFRITQQCAHSLMTLSSALEYKYRPTINYKVSVSREPDMYLGSLRVHIRTQSPSLISMFDSFFTYWTALENKLLTQAGAPPVSCQLSSGNFIRKLINPRKFSDTQIAEAICTYINLLDKAIKLFFAAPNTFSSVAPQLEADYSRLLMHTIL